MKIKRILSVAAMVGFVFGGVACSSSSDVDDSMSPEATESMEQAADASFDDVTTEDTSFDVAGDDTSYDSAVVDEGSDTSYDQPVEEIAQDTSFQEPAPYEPAQEDVSLGSSSSGLGK